MLFSMSVASHSKQVTWLDSLYALLVRVKTAGNTTSICLLHQYRVLPHNRSDSPPPPPPQQTDAANAAMSNTSAAQQLDDLMASLSDFQGGLNRVSFYGWRRLKRINEISPDNMQQQQQQKQQQQQQQQQKSN